MAAVLCVLLWGCGTATVTGQQAVGPAPAAKPGIVYVSDFDLDAAAIQSEPGLLSKPKLPGPLNNLVPPPPGVSKDPQKLARELIDSLGDSLVKNLNKAGVPARRLAPGASLPSTGWLIRGVFTEVNQGNQLSRAVIGFGTGKTDVHVIVDLHNLEQGVPRKFYALAANADSGTAPGAGPTILLGPAGVAGRFVIASKDLDHNVTQTASKISAEVVQRTLQTPGVHAAAGF